MSFIQFAAAEATSLSRQAPTYEERKKIVQPPKFKPGKHRNRKNHRWYTDEKGAVATFYQSPLQGKLGILGQISTRKHLTVVIEQGDTLTSIGFYPKGGNLTASVFKHMDGELWSPDPLYNKDSVPLYNKESVRLPLRIPMTKTQCTRFNNVFRSRAGKCRLIDGNTSSLCLAETKDCTELDRFECPDVRNYSLLGLGNYDNCITWLEKVFPSLSL